MSSSLLAARMSRMAPSATAAIFKRVAQLRASGADVISLAVGEPDADPPAHVLAAAKAAIDGGASRYTEVAGLPALRAAICEDSWRRRRVRHAPDEVVVSAGAKHALFNLAQALYDHGDEVIVPVPAWSSYAEQIRLCGATPRLLPCREQDGFLLRPEALSAALGTRTKAVVLCTPSNPTGAAYSAPQLQALAAVLRQHDCVVVVDEIYAELTYDGARSRSLLELAPDLRERIAIADGVSKRFAMTGYRVGWLLAPRAICSACEALQSQATTSVCAVSQHAARAALEGDDAHVLAMRSSLERRRARMLDGLAAIVGVRPRAPQGAFYVLLPAADLIARAGVAGDVELAGLLLDRARVAVVPGSDFHAPGYLRLSFATDESEIERALERLGEAIAGLASG